MNFYGGLDALLRSSVGEKKGGNHVETAVDWKRSVANKKTCSPLTSALRKERPGSSSC